MTEYVDKIFQDKPEDMSGAVQAPALIFLFEASTKDPTMMDKDEADMFHTMVAKLLFLCKRARPDIHTAVSFLCACVKSPDTEDYKKLGRIIKYLRGSKNMI